MALEVLAGVVLLVWCVLAFAHGGFWRPPTTLPAATLPAATQPAATKPSATRRTPSVVAIVPARDEATTLRKTLPTLLAQRNNTTAALSVIVVDDASSDGTGDVAAAAGAAVVRVEGPPEGWTGKVAAMAAGVDAAGEPDYLLFTDADIAYPPGGLAALVDAAEARGLSCVSWMARLRTASPWERLVVPAFVYFFAQLYPFRRVNGPGRTAAAAGGCMLVRRTALEDAGGLERIRGALIDDIALARLLKPAGRIWLGLSRDIVSIRPYPGLADLWQMVARSAYTQLRRSPLLLLLTVAGLLLTYAAPVALGCLGLATADRPLAALGLAAWALMSATYLPMLAHFGVSRWTAPLLPAVAMLYLAMTLDSARRHVLGRGGAWKGRTATR